MWFEGVWTMLFGLTWTPFMRKVHGKINHFSWFPTIFKHSSRNLIILNQKPFFYKRGESKIREREQKIYNFIVLVYLSAFHDVLELVLIHPTDDLAAGF